MFAQQPMPFKEPDMDVQSLLKLGHVRAEIEFLADVILCKQKMEIQLHIVNASQNRGEKISAPKRFDPKKTAKQEVMYLNTLKLQLITR
ncbi:hypothetical protein L3X38_009160 [Prunus dulcis]|uniref:Uncharacterized protein n=1 Tax=Prunus dulcis TaxID=3755 RepID=A0AAD4ZY25_PRUDU|nr:hypothetical protein L3X38_009160 [Prunus dulcis]